MESEGERKCENSEGESANAEHNQETQKSRSACHRNPQQEGKYLGEAGCEKHALEELPHLLKKLVDVRSFQHIDLENTSLRPGWRRTKPAHHKSEAGI